jgi:tetratricopeptide (TPR) repeat protein
MGYAGDWTRARELTDRAFALNPRSPGWYRYAAYFDHYRRGEYAEALAAAELINMPEYFTSHTALAAAHAELGHVGAAQRAAQEVLRLAPSLPEDGQVQLERFIFSQPDLVERFIDGLRKAGLLMTRRQCD